MRKISCIVSVNKEAENLITYRPHSQLLTPALITSRTYRWIKIPHNNFKNMFVAIYIDSGLFHHYIFFQRNFRILCIPQIRISIQLLNCKREKSLYYTALLTFGAGKSVRACLNQMNLAEYWFAVILKKTNAVNLKRVDF